MIWNAFAKRIYATCLELLQRPNKNKTKKEYVYALFDTEKGTLQHVYLTLKEDKNGIPYFIKDKTTTKDLQKVKSDEILDMKISLSEFSVANLTPTDQKYFFENGRYVNSHAESYLQIALHRNHISDEHNQLYIRDIVKLGKKGLAKLEYEADKCISEKSVKLAEMCLETNFGITLT